MAKKKTAWWLDDDPYSDRFYKYRNKDKAYFKVMFCEKCERAHEETYQDGTGMVTNYYLDFPTYGLRRITCKKCKGKKDG